MYVKEFQTKVKAAGSADGLKDGQVLAVVSVFGNVDSYGDVVMPGAFDEDLKAWKESGDPIPAIWSHDWRDPFSHIGTVLEASETEKGLETLYQIDLENNPKAEQVYRLLKGRRVTQSSFAYDILDAGWVEREDKETGKKYEVFELRKLHLFEVGPTLVGANQETELIEVKSAELARHFKTGRVLSQTNFDSLQKAYDSIGAVLASATPDDKSSGRTPDSKNARKTGHAADDPASDSGADPSAKSSAQESSNGTAQALARLSLSD
ncbi:HK97 family phage prohead protease [Rhodococcoides fascians]|uniref:HK97 family phage prohead protease n=1 Tax=Rhodococcoides fascians TaxID=1828 RepID=UPI00068F8138|nr:MULTISPECIES: HK97 family phage prohead protease [Rhodococcus]OZE98088.1 hypothetical protein CH301_17235 [Rhodococcus sp. 15-1189-1-1a]OZF12738.1 hypothetical protein CH299_17920 [Rhodococcus sp. 14-2686-1-2]